MFKKIKTKICEIICKFLKLHLAYVIMNVTVKKEKNNETRTIRKHPREKKKN
jgi:hypothetical protein